MASKEELFGGDDEQINIDQGGAVEKRSLVVAYLSYALEDVRTFCPTSLYLLQMAIDTLKKDDGSAHPVQ